MATKQKTAKQIENEQKKQQKKVVDKTQILNKLLSTKKKLYNERYDFSERHKLTSLLINLINENYEFTTEQINMFYDQIFFTTGYNLNFISSQITEHKRIIEYMITKYGIHDARVSIILDLGQYNNEFYYIYDALFKIKYDFTMAQYKTLRNKKYVIVPIDNYDTMHNNIIFALCSHIEFNNDIDRFNKCLDILKQSNLPFNIDHLNITTLMSQYYKEHMIRFLDVLFSKCDSSIFNSIINSGYTYNDRIIYSIIEIFGYDDNFIVWLFTKKIPANPEILFKIINKGYQISLSILNKLLESRGKETFVIENVNDYASINLPLKILQQKYKKTDKGFEIKYMDLFDIFNIEPDINTLNSVCKISFVNEINLLLNKYKIIPDHDTLNFCMSRLNYNLIHTILNYKITPDNDIILNLLPYQIRNESETVRKIIELFIEFGLIIKIDSVEHLLLNRFCLRDLERFDIKYDEQLYFLCYLSNFWPETYINKFTLDKKILNMHNICKDRYLSSGKLIAYMKDNNVKLDRYAIDILLNDNRYVFDDIYKLYNCVPSILSTFKKCNIPLKPIAILHNITAYDMLKQYEFNL